MRGCTEFGLKARIVMLRKNIKLKEVAEYLGFSSTYVSEIFKGTRHSARQEERIAEFLGMEGLSED